MGVMAVRGRRFLSGCSLPLMMACFYVMLLQPRDGGFRAGFSSRRLPAVRASTRTL